MDIWIHQSILHNQQSQFDDIFMTPIDSDRIEEKKHENIKSLIIEHIKNLDNLNENDQIKYINRLYQSSIIYLQNELFYTKQDLWKLSTHTFKNWNDIVSFVQDTQKIKWKSKCSILKCMYITHDASDEFNQRIRQIKDKTHAVLERKLKSPLQILEENEDGDIRWVVSLQWEIIDFTLRKREKSNNSNISKSIRESKYNSIEKTSDQYWLTFSDIDEKMIPALMEYISQIVFKKWIYDVKNQEVVTKKDVQQDRYISNDFKVKLLGAIEGEKKEETAKNYRVIKLITPLYKDDKTQNLSLEIKFEPKESRNETGIQMQWVYAYMRKISERIRLEQYVKPEYIENIVGMFIENLENTLESNINRENKDLHDYKVELFHDLKKSGHILTSYDLRNKHTKSQLNNLLHIGLTSYYKSKLRTTQINGTGKTYYTNSRNLDISKKVPIWKQSLLPEN